MSASETPTEMVLEGLYKSNLQDSVQLQIVLALYDQETIQNNGQVSHLRLKTSVRLCVDQTVRTRNFRGLNEIVERGSKSKNQKGKKAYVERKVGECFQWKANGQCSRGDSCSFSHDPASVVASGNGARLMKRNDHRLLPHQIRRPRLTVRYPQKVQATEEKALHTKGAESRADTENVTTRHVIICITRVSKLQV